MIDVLIILGPFVIFVGLLLAPALIVQIENYLASRTENKQNLIRCERLAQLKLISFNYRDVELFLVDYGPKLKTKTFNLLLDHFKTLKEEQELEANLKTRIDLEYVEMQEELKAKLTK